MSPESTFLQLVQDALAAGLLVRGTLSKPLAAAPQGLKNIYLRPVEIRGERRVQWLYRHATRDETKNLTAEETIAALQRSIGREFSNADVATAEETLALKTSRKGQFTLLRQKQASPQAPAAGASAGHNRIKERILPLELPWLRGLGIVDETGRVKPTAQDKWRQMNKFLETIQALVCRDGQSLLPPDARVVDMGSGKGYLTFALHHLLRHRLDLSCTTTGVELRPELVALCQHIAIASGCNGLDFAESDIATWQMERCDMLIALHACDTATDLAIAKGIALRTPFIIVAPCCHKQVRRDMRPKNELAPLLEHGILLERQAELLTDGIRALILESLGYRTKVFEFVSPEHTPKNVMITAELVRRPALQQEKIRREKLEQIAALKAGFGLEQHFLEGLLSAGGMP